MRQPLQALHLQYAALSYSCMRPYATPGVILILLLASHAHPSSCRLTNKKKGKKRHLVLTHDSLFNACRLPSDRQQVRAAT